MEDPCSIEDRHVMGDGFHLFGHIGLYVLIKDGLVEIPAFRNLFHTVCLGNDPYQKPVVIQYRTPRNTVLGKGFHHLQDGLLRVEGY